jgi:hypothetical protein
MPESRGRRPKTKSTRADGETGAAQGKSAENEHSILKKTLNVWKDVWAILGPGVAFTALGFALWPQIRVEAFVNPNPTDPIGTQFLITNSGNVPVYNVRFACSFGVGPGSTYIGSMVVDMPRTLSPLEVLPAGRSVTRSCVLSSDRSEVSNIRFTALYKWPIFGREVSIPAFYRVIKGREGTTYLLPDLLPQTQELKR